jgi:hypothetical protein
MIIFSSKKSKLQKSLSKERLELARLSKQLKDLRDTKNNPAVMIGFYESARMERQINTLSRKQKAAYRRIKNIKEELKEV